MNIIKKAKETIKKYSMFSRNAHIVIGLSGGPDSVCLSVILKKIQEKFGLKLSAVYIDHLLRPDDTEYEIALCRNICEFFDIDFFVRTLKSQSSNGSKKSHNLHDRLRKLRYAEYYKMTFELRADRIALGHTMDDQAETIIMNFLRGSGKSGLSGIPPVNGNIIRPLIEIKREDIESYLSKEKIDSTTDPSNKKDIFLRNRIRQNLIPQLKNINPSLSDVLSHSADIFRDEDDYLDRLVAQELEQILFQRDSHTIELLLSPFKEKDIAIQRRIIRRAFESVAALKGITFTHIDNVLTLFNRGKPGDSLDLPGNIRAIKSYSILKITSQVPDKVGEYKLDVPGSVCLKEVSFMIKAEIIEKEKAKGDGKKSAIFPSELLTVPLIVRSRRPGDYFYPYGFGKKKKLQDFFVDKKIPRHDRDTIALVTSGDDIIWVVGYRMDDRFKVRSQTKYCVQLKVEPFEIDSFSDEVFNWKI